MNNNIDKKFLIDRKIDNFIYCCGKSGSSTLQKSLSNSYHTHSFINFIRRKINEKSFDEKLNFDIFDIIDININKYNQSYVYFYDVYRTPIERKISAFFEHLKVQCNFKELIKNIKENYYLYSFNVNYLTVENIHDKIKENINILIEIFWWNFMINTDNYYSFTEYRNIIDFNIENENHFYQDNGKYRYIILKFDDIDNWSNILSFYHKKEINLIKSNITEEENLNKYNQYYKKFKENFTIPNVLFKIIFYKDFQMHEYHTICNHYKVMQKFYTKEKINKYINYWNNHSNNFIPNNLYDEKLNSDESVKNIYEYFKKNPRKNML